MFLLCHNSYHLFTLMRIVIEQIIIKIDIEKKMQAGNRLA